MAERSLHDNVSQAITDSMKAVAINKGWNIIT